MVKKKQKYYVVWKGAIPGIYSSWEECQNQINGYPDAKYKAFLTVQEAERAFQQSHKNYVGIKKRKSHVHSTNNTKGIIKESLSVDAACSGRTKLMEYRGVWTLDRSEMFKQGPFVDGTNNIGEFLAIVHGLAFLHNTRRYNTPIYTDSITAISWIKNKKVKTTLNPSDQNKTLFLLIRRALQWLKSNDYQNPILKWKTEIWGEIPADFGRK